CRSPRPSPVIASRGTLAIRTIETGAANQCRSPQIRMLRSRHWIAARLYALRIANRAALAMTGERRGLRHKRNPRPKLSSLIFDI
ncbi:MAG: hypothetical protein LBM98_09665, partial [Oscillospiraceae bacterium]|nr:hypothetical protein [Oscillospiraceae bacterium]